MKKAYLLCGALLALAASIASAAPGVNLRWNACLGDGGAINRNFACDTNSGANLLEGSFELGADLNNVNGAEIVLDLASAGATLPDWWRFTNLGVCRQNALSIQAHDGAGCPDWALGQASMNIAAYQAPSQFGPNAARLLLVNAVNFDALQNLLAGREYAVFQLTIDDTKTVGTPSCAGCLTPVCLVFSKLQVTRSNNAFAPPLTGPTNGTDSFYATWQGGAGVATYLGQGCPQATPTRNATWGSVKALYR
jgi:hypothetical protein